MRRIRSLLILQSDRKHCSQLTRTCQNIRETLVKRSILPDSHKRWQISQAPYIYGARILPAPYAVGASCTVQQASDATARIEASYSISRWLTDEGHSVNHRHPYNTIAGCQGLPWQPEAKCTKGSAMYRSH